MWEKLLIKLLQIFIKDAAEAVVTALVVNVSETLKPGTDKVDDDENKKERK